MRKKPPKILKSKLICPCCKSKVYKSEIKMMLKMKLPQWHKARAKIQVEDLVLYKNHFFNRDRFQWACDSCFRSKKAIKANPEKQTYCDFKPILAYYNINMKCEKCEAAYEFEKEEQQFWYEELGFWIQSKPKECPTCRKVKRKEKKYNNLLSELLNKKAELTEIELAQIAQIYNYIGNEPKRNQYLNKLKRKRKLKLDKPH